MSPKKSDNSRRQGTLNQGITFEIKICALLALRYIDSKYKIQDYEISQNVNHFGNFDDVVIKLKKENEQVLRFCIQLKHFQMDGAARNKVLKYSHFCERSKPKNKNPFDLVNYWKSIETAKGIKRNKLSGNLKYVIFTNKTRDENEQKFLPCLDQDIDFINIDGNAFSLSEFTIPKGELDLELEATATFNEIDSIFLKKLLILCCQPHEEDLNSIIKRTFQNLYNLDSVKTSEIISKYLDHVTNWVSGYCGERPLTKEEIKFKLGEFVFSPYLYKLQPNYNEFSDVAIQNWRRISEKYKTIIIDNCRSCETFDTCFSFVLFNMHLTVNDYTSITNWVRKITTEDVELLQQKFKNIDVQQEITELWGDEKVNEFTLQKVYFYLWKKDIIPLVLRFDKEDDLNISLNLTNFVSGKLIFVFSNMLQDSFQIDECVKEGNEFNILCNFSNLQNIDKNFILEQEVTLQGRNVKLKHITLKQFSSQLVVVDLIQILLNNFQIGHTDYELPDLFIDRYLSSIILKPEIFKERIIFVICCKNKDILTQYISSNKLNIQQSEIYELVKEEKSSFSSCYEYEALTSFYLPTAYKIVLYVDLEIEELKREISRLNSTSSSVKYISASIEDGSNSLILKFSDPDFIQTISIMIATKELIIAYLEFNNIQFHTCEIFEFSEVDLKNLPIVCKYIIASEDESKFFKNILVSTSIHLDFYQLYSEDKVYYADFLGSIGNSSKVKEVIDSRTDVDNKFQITHCFNYNNLNIITGSPGMGKSVLIHYLLNICPTEYWTVLVNFNAHSKYFMKKSLTVNDIEDVLKYFMIYENLSSLEQSMIDAFLDNKKLCLFFDGYDEIQPEAEDKVCAFLKLLLKNGYTLFLTTRNVKVEFLESKLNSVSRRIIPFGERDQFEYLSKYYKSKIDQKDIKIEQFVSKLLQITKTNMSTWDMEFSGIPLQTLMISEIYFEACEKFCRSDEEDDFLVSLDVLHMYERFIDIKISNLQAKENINNPNMETYFKRVIKLSLENHKHCALKAIFTLDLPQVQVQNCIDEVRDGDYKIGLIDSFLEDGTPVFVHRTFAEYLTALYISDNLQKPFVQHVLSIILKHSVYDIIRQILDRLLAKNCPLHRALLNRDKPLFVKLIKDKADLLKVDLGGRNLLHIGMSWGSRHSVPDMDEIEMINSHFGWDRFVKMFENAYTTYRKNKGSEEFVSLILNSTPTLLYQHDNILDSTPLDYAIKVLALQNVNLYLKHIFKLNNNFKGINGNLKYLWNYSRANNTNAMDSPYNYKRILFLSSIFDYDYLMLAIIKCSPLFFSFIPTTKYGVCSTSLMHFAAYCQANKVIDLLIQQGVQVDVVDTRREQSALHWAAARGHLSTVKLLCEKGADVKLLDLKSRRPLYMASENRRGDVMQLLSNAEAKVGGLQTKITPLFVASNVGDLEEVKLLLEAGADCDEKSDGGMTPLCTAAYQGHLEVAKFLLDSGANVDIVDTHGWTPLMQALWRCHEDVARLLITRGASKDKVTLGFCNALASRDNIHVLKLLLQTKKT